MHGTAPAEAAGKTGGGNHPAHGPFIPGKPEPIELPEDILQILGPGPEAIGVIDAQPQCAARLAHHQPGEDEIDRIAEMEKAAGGGGYAGTDHHVHSLNK